MSENINRENKEKKPNPVAAFLWKDKRRRAKNFYFLLVVFICLITAGMGYITEKLDLMSTGDDNSDILPGNEITQEVIYDEEELAIIEAIDSAGSLNDFLYQWANNGGELYSSKNVINVLLVGLDSKDALEYGGNSDSLILVSLNKKTEKISMCSFFRDSWCYMNVGGRDRYAKINSSYFHGGSDALIDTIERNFKIDIDYYVAVDFSSFRDIIDALGGITVPVQEYEANYINKTNPDFHIEAGEAVKLTGKQALVFARIRKSDYDSDVSRTRRQRQVITSLIESAKNASLSQLNNTLDALFKYVKTDLTKSQILSYAAQALAKGWLNYEITQFTLSDPEVFKTGYVGSAAVVFMDYPLAAQRVQTSVYGESNIVLDENRATVFDFVKRFG
ncbi:MAG: LCP family protein [Clostridia bacterium]|nr:LCP family protein [Clostridia bacterium]